MVENGFVPMSLCQLRQTLAVHICRWLLGCCQEAAQMANENLTKKKNIFQFALKAKQNLCSC